MFEDNDGDNNMKSKSLGVAPDLYANTTQLGPIF